MAKTLNGGALIPYGPTLPTAATTPDGALFYKTDGAVGGPQGLYMFGFIRDANLGALGSQVAQDWVQAVSPDVFVLKAGDTMTGALTVPGFLRITQTSGAQRVLVGNQDGGGANKPVILEATNGALTIGTGSTWVGSGGTLTTGLSLSVTGGAAGLTWLGGQVWHAGNDGAASTLDADLLDGQQGAFYRDAGNVNAGVLATARGGTGASNTLAQGSIIYASSSTTMNNNAVGTTGQVLLSGGTGAPTWANQSALSVGFATNANTANSATTAATATTATTATNVAWTGITGLPSAQQTFTNAPAAGFTTIAGPSLFYNFGNAGSLSPTPTQFVGGSISGFDAQNTSDMGSSQVGITVVGLGASGSRSMQLAASWNFEETAPSGLRFRVNDDTGTPGSWGAFRTIWDQGNLTAVSQLTNDASYLTTTGAATTYVAKAGDTMTGALTVPAFVPNGATVPVNGLYLPTANVLALSTATTERLRVDSAGRLLVGAMTFTSSSTQSGEVRSTGAAGFQLTNTTAANFPLSLLNEGTSGSRFMVNLSTGTGGGTSRATLGVDGSNGFILGVAGATRVTVDTSGNLTATGDVTAFSDMRLKRDVRPIERAIDKVMALTGVLFTRRADGTQGTGLLAQDVQAVLPEAVHEHADGVLSVAYGNLIGLLVQAIKEQQLELEALRAA